MKQLDIKTIPIVFFGTHEFAVTILKGLVDNPIFNVELVITQPDRPVGRKQILQPSPVKIFAEKNNLNLNQPVSLKNFKFQISNFKLSVVAQYGLLIPENILKTPSQGTINVHTSLLPKYRGASPIQSALLNGDKTTGITIMLMDKGLDSGPILSQKEIEILPDETYLELDNRLSKIASDTLIETIPDYILKKIKPKAQDESKVTFCKKLSREDGKIDWNKNTQKIYNQYRGLTPWPGIWTVLNNKRLKLLKIKPNTKKIKPGKIYIENGILLIGTNDSSIKILELQIEGKTKTDAKTFIHGYNNLQEHSLF